MQSRFRLDPTAQGRILDCGEFHVDADRYGTGVAALRLANSRGHVTVLPWMGQIVWDAVFDGVRLTMRSLFDAPVPAGEIIDTYGCFAFHSGLLRNGCPGPEDTHLLHGEMACAPIAESWLVVGEDDAGVFLRLEGERRYVRGFGNRYAARPSVTMRAGETLFEIAMHVANTGGAPMELMYMCHVNFDFVEGGEIIQPAPFDAAHVAVRTAVPAHVPTSPAYLARIAALAGDPSSSKYLRQSDGYGPEQVFYLKDLGRDAAGDTHLMLRRPQADAFAISYNPSNFPHSVRWLMCDADHKVAAFALPSTCEPEGYLAERAKGHIRVVPPGGHAAFTVRVGYLDRDAASRQSERIAALG